ncbi:MAG: hypothetical protein KFB93_02935 [Simkaniaceae bacterium]|nr:MAG: hypothetical protein KFB93_02935 [Simkaniaceae bacterium]
MSAPIAQPNSWESQWQSDRHHIDELMAHGKVGEALQYIFASVFMLIGDFVQDYRMNRQAKIMNALKEVQELRNSILNDFNQYNSSKTGSSVASDAVNDYNQLTTLMTEFEKKGYFSDTFVEGFEDHFLNSNDPNATIFQNTTLDVSSINTDWHNAWANAGTIPNQGGILGIVNNQFNEAKTTSQSSVVQAKINYWSKQESTAKAVVHMGFSSMTGVEKTANNNIGK